MRIFILHHNAQGAKRLDTEQKAAALEAENDNQKLKMQHAIEGLAKQLAGA